MAAAAQNYAINDLELCGLAIKITGFSQLLKRVYFDFVVDNLVLTHIMKVKSEQVTNRIKRLLDVLSSYSFNHYYLKGKDMILSKFMSWKEED